MKQCYARAVRGMPHEPAASRGRPQPKSQRGLLDSAVAGGGKANFVV